MRLLYHGLLVALCALPPSWALHASEVGIVDWHKNLIGIPLHGSRSTAPVFHRVGEETTQSVILTATESNVLAALSPVNGSLAWRHIFEPQDNIVQFRKHENVVVALSGPAGATLRSFDVLTGQLLLEKRLHPPEEGRMSNPGDLGTEISFIHDKSARRDAYPDIFVLTNGHTVRRIDGLNGKVKWIWTSPDQSSSTIVSHVVATPTTIYLIGLTKSIASYTLHLTALSTSTGEEVSSAHVPSSITHGLSDLLPVRNIAGSSDSPVVAWLQQGVLTLYPLTPKLVGKAKSIKGTAYKELIDVGLCNHGQFVAIKSDGSSSALRLNTDGSGFTTICDFADSKVPSNVHANSLYAGGFSHDDLPYIAHVRWSHATKKISIDAIGTHLADGHDVFTSFRLPFETNVHGIISHVAIDTVNPDPRTVLTRVVLTTSTGAVQLWQQDTVHWTREESLATISVAEFVELPEEKVILSHVGEGQETALARLKRQLADAQDLPQFIINFAKRFATGSYASVSSAPPADSGPLSRDAFGFRQIIVAATPFGKVFGIDSSNGNIIWSRVFGLGWAAEVGGRVLPVKLFVTRTASDGDTPQVVIVTQRKADNSLIDTVIFHLDALSGEDVRNLSPSVGILEGLDVISGPLLDAFLLRGDTKTVILIDEFLRSHTYPDTSQHRDALISALPSLHFPLRAGPHRVMGHQSIIVPELGSSVVGYPTWSFSLSPEEKIQAMFPSSKGPVASVGKVLGNRTTLYKYLNPRLFVILTESPLVSPTTCGVHVVDSAKGSVIYRKTVPASAGMCDVKASLTENWLVYHYYDDTVGIGKAKGYRMVSVELYEGSQIDDKTGSSDMSSYSNASIEVTAIEQSYIFPHGITAIATTSTKFGIAVKDILVANRNHQIQCYSHRFLDPRRPDRKTTTAEQEEFLIQYDPVLPNDPRRILSHNYEVASVRRIVTSPALLESTSLVFAYGLDLFLTRIAPSNTFDVLSENFNKAQLVFTISGLALAIMVTKPMVARKRLRERWYP